MVLTVIIKKYFKMCIYYNEMIIQYSLSESNNIQSNTFIQSTLLLVVHLKITHVERVFPARNVTHSLLWG